VPQPSSGLSSDKRHNHGAVIFVATHRLERQGLFSLRNALVTSFKSLFKTALKSQSRNHLGLFKSEQNADWLLLTLISNGFASAGDRDLRQKLYLISALKNAVMAVLGGS